MLPWELNNLYKELSMFDEPNTLYAFMESIVNYNREEKVKIKDLSKYARETIFDFDYPISETFDKEKFETMFLDHYMFRRINYDTFTSFQIHLKVKLNDIMPKYNKMVEGFNSLDFKGLVETHERFQTDLNNSQSNVTSKSSDSSISDVHYSDTPQSKIEEVQSGEYMTEYTYNTANSDGSSSSESTSSNSGTTNETITISRADELEEYQKFLTTVNNIYSDIFKECDVLFYGLI